MFGVKPCVRFFGAVAGHYGLWFDRYQFGLAAEGYRSLSTEQISTSRWRGPSRATDGSSDDWGLWPRLPGRDRRLSLCGLPLARRIGIRDDGRHGQARRFGANRILRRSTLPAGCRAGRHCAGSADRLAVYPLGGRATRDDCGGAGDRGAGFADAATGAGGDGDRRRLVGGVRPDALARSGLSLRRFRRGASVFARRVGGDQWCGRAERGDCRWGRAAGRGLG